MFARIENDQVIEYPISNLAERFPNASLPSDLTNNSGLPEGYVYIHSNQIPEYNITTHKAVHSLPINQNGKWIQNWQIEPLTTDELFQIEKDASVKAKNQRNRLLANSDWTQLPDSTADKIAWAAYRQQLRDITTQPGFPFNITWPVLPNTV